jgi:hypothetical protein
MEKRLFSSTKSMGDQAMFNLMTEIAAWRKTILETKTCTSNDLNELESHLVEEVEQLKTQSLTEQEAFMIATSRIGKPVEIAGEFAKLNKRTVSCSRILWACFAVVAYFAIFRAFYAVPVPFLDPEKLERIGVYVDTSRNFWPLACHIAIPVLLAMLIITFHPNNYRSLFRWFR